jgi:hypothetical protein
MQDGEVGASPSKGAVTTRKVPDNLARPDVVAATTLPLSWRESGRYPACRAALFDSAWRASAAKLPDCFMPMRMVPYPPIE